MQKVRDVVPCRYSSSPVATVSERFFLLTVLKQGSYRSWKTWKVMEFKNVISRRV